MKILIFFLFPIYRELSQKNRSLQESYQQEIKNRTRLTLHNEELQWKLKQNSEKFTTALNELSKSYQDRSNFLTDCKNSFYGSIVETNHGNTDSNQSPPSSPVVKGLVEKSDSVSWVLEINDEESPEALANRIVKRAGSFRGSFKERSPSFKRQLSLGGVNALCQSASATAILRQHSESPTKCSTPSTKPTKSSRTRSNSLNVSNEAKKMHHSLVEPLSAGFSKWENELQMASTPMKLINGHENISEIAENVCAGVSSYTRSSSLSTDDADVDFAVNETKISPNACNTIVGRSDFSATLIPSHNGVEKLHKKRQQIKESAGEAMVAQRSYANSEDDQSSGSDIDSMSTSNSTSPSHSDTNKHRHLSMNDEAIMHKIVASLNSTRSTPMEVSWSEDGDNDIFCAQNESSA